MKPDFFKYLPTEITTNILLRLSVRSIAVSKCVCKPWLQLLKTDDFIKSHFAQSPPALALSISRADSNWLKLFELEEDELDLDRYYDENRLACFDFPYEASMAGSANGFLFLHDTNRGYCYVCNPITREFVELRCGFGAEVTCGFGVSKSGQHKVVKFSFRSVGENRRFECHVYSLGTGSWRLVEVNHSFDRISKKFGAFVHGNLHWMSASDFRTRLYCFDLETERLSRLALPPIRVHYLNRQVYALRDSLGFCEETSSGVGVAIWMMKEYGVEKSWTKECVIVTSPYPDRGEYRSCHPIKAYDNGDVLLLFLGTFFYYSEKTKTCREIGGLCDLYGSTSLLHTPSMVSLRCFGGMENVISF